MGTATESDGSLPRGYTRLEDGNLQVSPTSTGDISLEGIRQETIRLRFRAGPPKTVTLKGADQRHSLVVTDPIRVKVSGERRLGCLVVRSRKGPVSIEGTVGKVVVEAGSYQASGFEQQVVLRDGELKSNKRLAKVEYHGGTLPEDIGQLHVSNEAPPITVKNHLRVQDLTAAAGTSVHLQGERQKVTRSLVRCTIGYASVPVLNLENVRLTVSGSEPGLSVEGDGGLRVPAGVLLTGLRLSPDVAVEVQSGAALLDLTGQVLVASVADAALIAPDRDRYELVGIHAPKEPRSELVAGATLRGVYVPPTATGRGLLRRLEGAAVVEPCRDAIPSFTDEPSADLDSRKRTDRRYFAQELAGLASDRCPDGNLRTLASWAGYRARHLQASSRFERGLYRLYRLVGYGQRPGPAAATWIAVSVGVGLLLAFTPGAPNAGASVVEVINRVGLSIVATLIGPITLLRLASEATAGDLATWAGIGRLVGTSVAAAPFVFLLLALSRLLRAEWPWGSG